MDYHHRADNLNRIIGLRETEMIADLVFPNLDGPFVNWRSVTPGKIAQYSTYAPDQLAVALA